MPMGDNRLHNKNLHIYRLKTHTNNGIQSFALFHVSHLFHSKQYHMEEMLNKKDFCTFKTRLFIIKMESHDLSPSYHESITLLLECSFGIENSFFISGL